MKKSDEKDNFLRSGVSGIVLVIVAAGLVMVAVTFVSWKFQPSGSVVSSQDNRSDSQKGFFERTSAVISKTFGDMFSSGQDKPAAEIDLGEPAASGNNNEIKNPPPRIIENKSLSVQPSTGKKSNKKISENQNSDPPARNPGAEVKPDKHTVSPSLSFQITETAIHPSLDSKPVASGDPNHSELSAPPLVVTCPESCRGSRVESLCDVTKIQTPNHQILFSEIAWMGSKKSANDEWIELKNNSGRDLRLSGWQILSGDDNNVLTVSTPQSNSGQAHSTGSTSSPQASSLQVKIIFDEKDNFPAGSLYLLERGNDDSAPAVPADKLYSGALSNTGARLKLFDANCNLVDEINFLRGWPAGNNDTKETMERSLLDLSWHTSGLPGGTPKIQNSAAFSTGGSVNNSVQSSASASTASAGAGQTAPIENQTSSAAASAGAANTVSSGTAPTTAPAPAAKILISAIQTTGGSGKSDNDFIKLYNLGDSTMDVSAWQLKKKTQSGTESSIKVFPSGSAIAGHGYFVWANSENNFAVSVGANVSSTGYLSDNYSIALFDTSGKIIDAIAWGSGHTNPFVESSTYPTNPAANQILSRKSLNGAMQDSDNNAEDFEIK